MKKQIIPFTLIITMLLLFTACNQAASSAGPGDVSSEQIEEEIKPTDEVVISVDVKPEQNDWSNIWIENANQSEKPRLLLVGDSITDGYYSRVKKSLEGQYYLARYTTSKFVGNPDFQTELTTILNRYEFKIIHVNNGLHGGDYSIDEYQKGLEDLRQIFSNYAPNAKIIWCMTTPVRNEENLDYLGPLNQDVILRNQTALKIMGENGFLINDLYIEMLGHPEYYQTDGFHFNQDGRTAQAELVSSFILKSD